MNFKNMNISDIIVPLILAFATVWGVNYFFFNPKDRALQHEFSAPQSKVECQPLQKEVLFSDEKRSKTATIIPVETEWGSLEFSTNGGSLSRLMFNRPSSDTVRSIGTIFPSESEEWQGSPFLVALESDTPYFYRVAKQHETDTTFELSFEGSSDVARISKTFIIYKNMPQVDVAFQIDPRGDNVVQPRILYPAPIMPALKENQMISADILVGTEKFKKEARSNIKPDNYWIQPLLFGAENKYFVHALVNDAGQFVKRAYYNLVGENQLQVILEGPAISKTEAWTLSFYMGPKESAPMSAVDERLENTLEYSGMWAPISRFLLMLLNWMYEYVHNYGYAIILLTACMRLLLLPFSLRAKQGMGDQAENRRQLQYIQQKYKNDPQAKAAAQAEHMRKHGLGLSGCLPMFIQMPLFFGLSKVLSNAIELYQAPFLWIKDLSSADPYYILPAAVVIGILYRALSIKDNNQRVPLLAMALVFGAVSTTLPAGLVLYIAISSALNVT
jgi:YidC/Oxa1 family membrane protein insertase